MQAALAGATLVLTPTSRQLGESFRPLGLSLRLVRPRILHVPSRTAQLLGTVREAVEPGHQGPCPHMTMLSPGQVAWLGRIGAGAAWHTADLGEQPINMSGCPTSHR